MLFAHCCNINHGDYLRDNRNEKETADTLEPRGKENTVKADQEELEQRWVWTASTNQDHVSFYESEYLVTAPLVEGYTCWH